MNIARSLLVTASLALGLFATQRSVAARPFDGPTTRINAAAWSPGTIPPNGPASSAPTLAEWNAVSEVNVSRSTEFHCETKVVREWFRSSCTAYGKWTMLPPVCQASNGDPCYVWSDPGGSKASIVQRLRRGQNYGLKFVWNPGAVAYVLSISVDQAGGAMAGF